MLPWCVGLFVYMLIGFEIPLVYQEQYDSPRPPFTQGRSCEQDFLFPEIPVSALVLPFGTFARDNEGSIEGSVGVIGQSSATRNFTLDLTSLVDNQWHRIEFDPITAEPLSRGRIKMTSGRIMPGNEVVLWVSSEDRFRDGSLHIDGSPTTGDMAFRLLGRLKGINLVRLAGSRWKLAKPRIFDQPFLVVLVIFGLMISLVFSCISIIRDDPRRGTP